ncbi:MAG: hypothetical protein IVW52_20795 [Acidimicrobiales bacterium]|nr:hypothetical protein [Acidimicrobiales bacterium]
MTLIGVAALVADGQASGLARPAAGGTLPLRRLIRRVARVTHGDVSGLARPAAGHYGSCCLLAGFGPFLAHCRLPS